MAIVQSADIVVLGAGVMGASIAFQLARNSNKSIILVDQSAPVGGMSGRSFGQIRQHYSNELLVNMSIRGFEVIQNWQCEVGYGDAGYTRMGYLLLVVEEQMAALQRNVELGQRCGVDTQVVDRQEIGHIEPVLHTADLAGGAYEPNGGYIDVQKMVLSWLGAAQSLGVRLLSGVRAEAIETRGDTVSGIRTSAGMIACERLVNASGAWACDLLSPLGIAVPLERRRIEMAYRRLPAGVPSLSTCITDGNSNVVIRPDMGRDLLAVAYPPQLPMVADPMQAAPAEEVDEHDQRLHKAFSERLPGYENSRSLHTVSGTYDVMPDFHPVLGWVPQVEGLCLATGFSGHGLKLAPAIGEVIADTVLGKKAAFDINALRLSRFDENDLMHLAYGPNSARA